MIDCINDISYTDAPEQVTTAIHGEFSKYKIVDYEVNEFLPKEIHSSYEDSMYEFNKFHYALRAVLDLNNKEYSFTLSDVMMMYMQFLLYINDPGTNNKGHIVYIPMGIKSDGETIRFTSRHNLFDCIISVLFVGDRYMEQSVVRYYTYNINKNREDNEDDENREDNEDDEESEDNEVKKDITYIDLQNAYESVNYNKLIERISWTPPKWNLHHLLNLYKKPIQIMFNGEVVKMIDSPARGLHLGLSLSKWVFISYMTTLINNATFRYVDDLLYVDTTDDKITKDIERLQVHGMVINKLKSWTTSKVLSVQLNERDWKDSTFLKTPIKDFLELIKTHYELPNGNTLNIKINGSKCDPLHVAYCMECNINRCNYILRCPKLCGVGVCYKCVVYYNLHKQSNPTKSCTMRCIKCSNDVDCPRPPSVSLSILNTMTLPEGMSDLISYLVMKRKLAIAQFELDKLKMRIYDKAADFSEKDFDRCTSIMETTYFTAEEIVKPTKVRTIEFNTYMKLVVEEADLSRDLASYELRICDNCKNCTKTNHCNECNASLCNKCLKYVPDDDTKHYQNCFDVLLFQQCPECSRLIYKRGGCENVDCPCGKYFKWVISKPMAYKTIETLKNSETLKDVIGTIFDIETFKIK